MMEAEIMNPQDCTLLLTDENLKNASSLLALLHGKSDSICRLFKKEIIVDKNSISALNDMMVEKLRLHSVSNVTTTIDVTLSSKKVLTFKAWPDFETYNFEKENSATKSVFIQWDFFAMLSGYQIPQRHTVSIRIASAPNPSDVFKVLLSGGFDESDNIDIQSATMLCKVDFINNTLAEELINVAESWNDLQECAYSSKGRLKPFLQRNRRMIAHFFESIMWIWLSLAVAIAVKYCLVNNYFSITNTELLYALIAFIPVFSIIRELSKAGASWLFDSLDDLMDIHIFKITVGDNKQNKKIQKRSSVKKEIAVFILNTIVTFVLSYIFYKLGK